MALCWWSERTNYILKEIYWLHIKVWSLKLPFVHVWWVILLCRLFNFIRLKNLTHMYFSILQTHWHHEFEFMSNPTWHWKWGQKYFGSNFVAPALCTGYPMRYAFFYFAIETGQHTDILVCTFFLKHKIPSKQFWKAKVLPIIKAPLPDNTAQVTCCSHAYTEPYFKRPALAQSIIPRFAWMKNNLTLEAKWLFSKLIINITN